MATVILQHNPHGHTNSTHTAFKQARPTHSSRHLQTHTSLKEKHLNKIILYSNKCRDCIVTLKLLLLPPATVCSDKHRTHSEQSQIRIQYKTIQYELDTYLHGNDAHTIQILDMRLSNYRSPPWEQAQSSESDLGIWGR